MFPTRSVENNLTVVVLVTPNGPAYGCAVGLVVGSEPSVVYSVCATPEPASFGVSVIDGTEVCQPAQPPVQAIEVIGAAPSAVTVNELGFELSPAPFVAVMLFGSAGSTALPVKVYVRLGSEPEALQPLPSAGKL